MRQYRVLLLCHESVTRLVRLLQIRHFGFVSIMISIFGVEWACMGMNVHASCSEVSGGCNYEKLNIRGFEICLHRATAVLHARCRHVGQSHNVLSHFRLINA